MKILPILVSKQVQIPFFEGQRFEEKNFSNIRVQTYIINFFFLKHRDFERSAIPFERHWLLL